MEVPGECIHLIGPVYKQFVPEFLNNDHRNYSTLSLYALPYGIKIVSLPRHFS